MKKILYYFFVFDFLMLSGCKEIDDENITDLSNGPNFQGHGYVDLGLKDNQGHTIYWATCNVGAVKPEDYGLYFAWGETKGYTYDTSDGHFFYWSNYTHCNGSNTSMTKYCSNSKYGIVDNKNILEPEDDAAHVNWGGDWRMPTIEEQKQLLRECQWTWDNSKKGCTVQGPNGNTIFLPAAGYRRKSEILRIEENLKGVYWSSTLNISNSLTEVTAEDAYDINFDSKSPGTSSSYRSNGLPIRAVCVSTKK